MIDKNTIKYLIKALNLEIPKFLTHINSFTRNIDKILQNKSRKSYNNFGTFHGE